jgi:hypothetical protein
MANGHGGKRAGAGRKRGGKNTASIRQSHLLLREAIERGETPLQYMLSVMQDKDAPIDRRDAMACAAAPYVHPRLAAVESKQTLETGDTLAALLKEIDGRTTGIAQGGDAVEGATMAAVKSLLHH